MALIFPVPAFAHRALSDMSERCAVLGNEIEKFDAEGRVGKARVDAMRRSHDDLCFLIRFVRGEE